MLLLLSTQRVERPVAGNLYLLKDLSRFSGHSSHTIKFYLKRGLIKEVGRSPETQFRYFDDSTLNSLSRIREWRRQGKSLAQITELLELGDHSVVGVR